MVCPGRMAHELHAVSLKKVLCRRFTPSRTRRSSASIAAKWAAATLARRILDGESPQLVRTSLQLPGPPACGILTICREFEP